MTTTIRTGAVPCSACGRKVPRAARQQLYCSGRCRRRAHWDRRATAKISAFPTHDTGYATNPLKTSTETIACKEKNRDRAPSQKLRSMCWAAAGAGPTRRGLIVIFGRRFCGLRSAVI
jgi:hypothetical protein